MKLTHNQIRDITEVIAITLTSIKDKNRPDPDLDSEIWAKEMRALARHAYRNDTEIYGATQVAVAHILRIIENKEIV